jgi:tetratricopeptide (TPR) repeat protein
VTDTALDTLLKAAFAHHQNGALDDAETLYRRVLAHDPDNLNALQLLGLLLHARDRLPAALGLLEQAVAVADRRGDRSPHYAVLHNNLGNALLALADLPGAIASYEAARRLGVTSTACLLRLAGAYTVLDDIARAEASYREAAAALVGAGPAQSSDAIQALAALANLLREKHYPALADEVGCRLVALATDGAALSEAPAAASLAHAG